MQINRRKVSRNLSLVSGSNFVYRRLQTIRTARERHAYARNTLGATGPLSPCRFGRISRRYIYARARAMEISQTGYKTSPCWLPDDKGYCQSPSAAGTMAAERNSRSMSMTGNERSYIKQSRVCVNMKIHRREKPQEATSRFCRDGTPYIVSYLAFNL